MSEKFAHLNTRGYCIAARPARACQLRIGVRVNVVAEERPLDRADLVDNPARCHDATLPAML